MQLTPSILYANTSEPEAPTLTNLSTETRARVLGGDPPPNSVGWVPQLLRLLEFQWQIEYYNRKLISLVHICFLFFGITGYYF